MRRDFSIPRSGDQGGLGDWSEDVEMEDDKKSEKRGANSPADAPPDSKAVKTKGRHRSQTPGRSPGSL